MCDCCTAQGMHMHMWTMPCQSRGDDENRHPQPQCTRLTLMVLRASGQTASQLPGPFFSLSLIGSDLDVHGHPDALHALLLFQREFLGSAYEGKSCSRYPSNFSRRPKASV